MTAQIELSQRALAFLQEGKGADAERIYRQLLEAEPGNTDAQHHLGLALLRQDRVDEGVEMMRTALKVKPKDQRLRYNLALALLKDERFKEGVTDLIELTRQAPRHAPYHAELGRACALWGQYEAAELAYRNAVACAPDFGEAHLSLAQLRSQLGRSQEADENAKRAVELLPQDPTSHLALGNVAFALDRLDQAERSYAEAVRLDPTFAEAHRNLGAMRKKRGDYNGARLAFQAALQQDPNYAEAYKDLASIQRRQTALAGSLENLDTAIRLQPDDAEAHDSRGLVLERLERFSEARDAFARALELNPRSVYAHSNYARIQRFTGDKLDILQKQRLLQDDDISAEEKSQLKFALGYAHDSMKEFDTAFGYFREANEEIRQRTSFDPTPSHERATRIMQATPLSPNDTTSADSPVPIVVMGMSRSGKSLVEQMLIRHPEVHGCGESVSLGDEIRAVSQELGLRELPEISDDPRLSAGVAERYMAQLIQTSPEANYLVDTRPFNIWFVSLILRSLPNARIICCDRDPLDNGLYVYFTRYVRENEYAWDLYNIGAMLALFERLVLFWQNAYGDRILRVNYETLVASPEAEMKRIYAHCGLSAEQTPQLTPAKVEVGRAVNYAKYLGRLREGLEAYK